MLNNIPIIDKIAGKAVQCLVSVLGGFVLALETSVDYFVPCLLAVVLDVVSAFFLGRRVHKKHPEKSDGKFKSEYKWRVLTTMSIVFICILLGAYVDLGVRRSDDGLAVRFVMVVFLFYEGWSCLENWSSENENKIARALQRVMVNKAERHLQVPLADIFGTEDKNNQRGRSGRKNLNNPNSKNGEGG